MTKIVKGEDVVIPFTVRDADKYPVDLTGKTLEIKSKINGALVTFSSPNVIVINGPHGKAQLTMSDAVTETLKVGFFNFDIYIDPNTSSTRIIKMIEKVTVVDRER